MFASKVFANTFSLTSFFFSMLVALGKKGNVSEFCEVLFSNYILQATSSGSWKVLSRKMLEPPGWRSGERIIANVKAINILRS